MDTFFCFLTIAGSFYNAPKEKYILTDLFGELLNRNVEIRIVDNLWNIADAIKTSTLDWSLCRMANALPRP